jgi:predicted neutral ceramidase superfamily lipid hydrolase
MDKNCFKKADVLLKGIVFAVFMALLFVAALGLTVKETVFMAVAIFVILSLILIKSYDGYNLEVVALYFAAAFFDSLFILISGNKEAVLKILLLGGIPAGVLAIIFLFIFLIIPPIMDKIDAQRKKVKRAED